MIEFVFRHSRVVGGKRVYARVFSGRYAVEKGAKPVTVCLNTPDRDIARKRLRAVVLEKQREAEGIIAPKAVRVAAVAPLTSLLNDYETDLTGRGLAEKHVHDTTTRLRRMIGETSWRVVSDIRPDSFAKWRAGLACSAKTKKEYQISASAFLNWLVKTERLLMNPLAKLDAVDVRGKQVRACRAFTEEELQRLFAIAGKRRLAYQMLLYTGQRKSEVRALVWGDLHLNGAQPYALFRESTTKDKDKRAVPLRREVAEELRQIKPQDVSPTKRVFWFCWPTYDILRGDLERAGIERKDALGRVVHFHSFRKTWQTLGVRYGINQRVAQEVLGHSDANLTAKVYTDVPALGLHAEIAKLPWIAAAPQSSAAGVPVPAQTIASTHENQPSEELTTTLPAHTQSTQIRTQKSGNPGHSLSLADLCAKFVESVNITEAEGFSRVLSSLVTSLHCDKMAARAGIEPATK
jgi:integrase